MLLATVCTAGLIVTLRQTSRRVFGWLSGPLMGVAAGLCHALSAVYLKLTVEEQLDRLAEIVDQARREAGSGTADSAIGFATPASGEFAVANGMPWMPMLKSIIP